MPASTGAKKNTKNGGKTGPTLKSKVASKKKSIPQNSEQDSRPKKNTVSRKVKKTIPRSKKHSSHDEQNDSDDVMSVKADDEQNNDFEHDVGREEDHDSDHDHNSEEDHNSEDEQKSDSPKYDSDEEIKNDDSDGGGKKKKINAVPKRRGPGRPPSKPPAKPLPLNGIVSNPKYPHNRFEFALGDPTPPTIFKSLFNYFKNLKVQQITTRYDPQRITFFAKDHTGVSDVIAYVEGKHVNWYYCEGTFWLSDTRETVAKMYANIDKSFHKISLYYRHDTPDHFKYVFKDSDLEKECLHQFDVTVVQPDEEWLEIEKNIVPSKTQGPKNKYPVQFTLTAKAFKKSINDVVGYSDRITYEKIGSEYPLQLTYITSGHRYNEVYHNSKKIKLYSEVKQNRTFRATIKISTIKSLASAMVTKNIRILCRETNYMLFRSDIDDKVLIVNTLAKLS